MTHSECSVDYYDEPLRELSVQLQRMSLVDLNDFKPPDRLPLFPEASSPACAARMLPPHPPLALFFSLLDSPFKTKMRPHSTSILYIRN